MKKTNWPQMALKFEKLSAAYTKKADKLYASLEGAQTNTPKRAHQAQVKRNNADLFKQRAAYAEGIAKGYADESLSVLLQGFSPVMKDDTFAPFLYRTESGGHYTTILTTEARFESYLSEGDAARIGIRPDQMYEAYQQLISISNTGISDEEKKKREIKDIENQLRFQKISGFFPTPDELIHKMIGLAPIGPNDRVLEPSAGIGSIAQKVREHCPECTLHVVERQYTLLKLLELKGFDLKGTDFDTFDPTEGYDVILMNPPFEKGADVRHITKAFWMLKPGGRLVSICSESPFFNNNKTSVKFREFVALHGVARQLPAGSFKSAFRSTGVSTRMVILERPLD